MSEDNTPYNQQRATIVKNGNVNIESVNTVAIRIPSDVAEVRVLQTEVTELKAKLKEQTRLLETIAKLHTWGEPPEGYANALKWIAGQIDKLLKA